MKIGVLGGTFNPVHNGHLLLAQWAKEQYKLDKVIFMPAGNPYQKKGVLPLKDRMEILKAAVGGRYEISDLESSQKKASYSCDTMSRLKKTHPKDSFYFILGFDCLQNIDTWKDPGRLLKNCEIIAASRAGAPREALEKTAADIESRYGGKVHIMDFPDIGISSTMIRERIAKGLSARYMIPEAAADVIDREHFYSEYELPEEEISYSGNERKNKAEGFDIAEAGNVSAPETESEVKKPVQGTKEAVPAEGYRDYRLLTYFGAFLAAFAYWESFLRIYISGGAEKNHLTLLFFLPAEAMFFAAICGFHKKHTIVNKILGTFFMFIAALYYEVQFVYYRIFGSVLSVSMLGMGGEAIGDFGWALGGVIADAIGYILLLLIPVVIFALLSFIRFRGSDRKRDTDKSDMRKGRSLLGGGYAIWLHAVALALVVPLWFGGIGGLKLLGTERGSAYYVMTDAMSDSDTTSERIGTLATSVVEAVTRYTGLTIGDGHTSVAAVDQNALMLGEIEDENAPAGNTIAEDAGVASGSDAGKTGAGENAGMTGAGAGTENAGDTGAADNSGKPENSEEKAPAFEPVSRVNPDIDFKSLAEKTTDPEIISLCGYFDSKRPTKTNEYTGLFKDHNLIYICAEAFSNYGIDPDITPTLYKMANNGIVLNNFYNSFPNTTTNGEFAFSASLWPDVSRTANAGSVAGSFAQSTENFMPYGPGDLFAGEGASTYAYHNFYGYYYWRNHSWPNIGYENIKFMGSGMEFTSSWPSSDLEMFEQSVDDYIGQDKFLAYYMTFSGHGPYNSQNYMYNKNIDTVKELAGDKYENDSILGYFCGEYELELGMEYLLGRLEEAGKLEDTVIVLIGDHFPYYLPDQAKKELVDAGSGDMFEEYHSTCIIYNAGLEEPVYCDEYCCNVDILPTVLNLFDIDYDSRLLCGNDVFSNGVHRARLYNGSFITDYVSYDKKEDVKVWSDKVSDYSENVRESYFEAMLDYTENEYSASLQMMKKNFLLYVWENSGLLTEEEVNEELAREKSTRGAYEGAKQREYEQALENAAPQEEAPTAEDGTVTPD